MAFPLPTVDDFKTQFPGDFPYAVPGFGASGVASIAGGGVTGVTLSAGGQGYKSPPNVVFTALPTDPTGTGAAGTATIASGAVTLVTITSPGVNYLYPPLLSFACVDGDPTDLQRVRDLDILQAIANAKARIPNGIWPDEPTYVIAFNLGAAHFLALALRSRFQGVRGQGGDWLLTSKSAGDVSAAYDFPERIKRSIILAPFMKTSYGCDLVAMLAPYMVGGAFTVCAPARP